MSINTTFVPARTDAQRRREYAAKRREQKRESNECERCAEPRGIGVLCVDHWLALQAHGSGTDVDTLKALWCEQQALCAYTGRVIAWGVNAGIDHKVPRTRGGSCEKHNLHWIDRSVNQMKGEMTHDEFVAACKVIAATF